MLLDGGTVEQDCCKYAKRDWCRSSLALTSGAALRLRTRWLLERDEPAKRSSNWRAFVFARVASLIKVTKSDTGSCDCQPGLPDERTLYRSQDVEGDEVRVQHGRQ